VVGKHPFAVRIFYGDTRSSAFIRDEHGRAAGPGVQIFTPATTTALDARPLTTRARLLQAAGALGVDLPWLLNTAGQVDPEGFTARMDRRAAAADRPGLQGEQRATLEQLKRAVDEAQALGPLAIVAAAMNHLADGPSRYANLVDYINRALSIRRDRGTSEAPVVPVRSIEEISAAGMELWWVKEGSATIVFQVLVRLTGDRAPVRFALNVAKDLTAAAAELRRTFVDLTEIHRLDAGHVVQPLGHGTTSVRDWRGDVSVPLLAAEWFDGHELHVYPGSPRLHLWLDQEMSRDHPLPAEVSDEVWETMVRICARYTRVTPAGIVPLGAHINAGDFIFRQQENGRWQVVLIWCRPPPPASPPEDYVVLSALLAAGKAFGTDRDVTVWWDQPERALQALRAGLAEAGLDGRAIEQLLRRVHEGVFTEFADAPERIPYLAWIHSGDREELRRVFERARLALGEALARAPG
jgi:hypothetical protein